MKKIPLLIAATIGSTLFGSASSMAQPQIQFGIGPDGRPQVGVTDPARERAERREYWRERSDAERTRAYEAGRQDAMREQRAYGGHCRNVTIREDDDMGNTVTRRIRRCD